jgi:phosphoribosylaminoimidazole carboxylase PurE protein
MKAKNGSPEVRVGILMGSESDRAVVNECAAVLTELGIGHEVLVRSAHRTPDAVRDYVRGAEARGIRVLVAAAGGAAHLAGAVASHGTLPVIGIPLAATPLAGLDSLLATVQMPAGVPVATVAIGAPGARNAGYLAAQILAVGDRAIAERVRASRRAMAEKVVGASAAAPAPAKEKVRARVR